MPEDDRERWVSAPPPTTADGWLADLRTDAVAGERSRQEWLTQQAVEEATMAGLLLELAEHGAAVQVSVPVAGWLHGTISAVGQNVVVLLTTTGGTALVPLTSLVAVRPGPTAAEVWGDRVPRTATTLHEVLSVWREDRPAVTVVAGMETFHGELVGVGLDVLTLQREQPPRLRTHVALAGIHVVTTLERLVSS